MIIDLVSRETQKQRKAKKLISKERQGSRYNRKASFSLFLKTHLFLLLLQELGDGNPPGISDPTTCVKFFDGVEPLCSVVAADGVESALHDGHPHPGTKH